MYAGTESDGSMGNNAGTVGRNGRVDRLFRKMPLLMTSFGICTVSTCSANSLIVVNSS